MFVLLALLTSLVFGTPALGNTYHHSCNIGKNGSYHTFYNFDSRQGIAWFVAGSTILAISL